MAIQKSWVVLLCFSWSPSRITKLSQTNGPKVLCSRLSFPSCSHGFTAHLTSFHANTRLLDMRTSVVLSWRDFDRKEWRTNFRRGNLWFDFNVLFDVIWTHRFVTDQEALNSLEREVSDENTSSKPKEVKFKIFFAPKLTLFPFVVFPNLPPLLCLCSV